MGSGQAFESSGGKYFPAKGVVITTGGSTLQAIEAIEREGGKVAFVAVLVDRQEGGREAIDQAGYPVVAAFTRDELMA